MNDCLFCKIAAGEIPSTCLYNDDDVYAFRDINPQMLVHFLVIPKQHIDSVAAITAENSAVVAKCFEVIAKLAAQEGLTGGFMAWNASCSLTKLEELRPLYEALE